MVSEDEIERLAERSLNPEQARMLRLLRNRYLAGEQVDFTVINRDTTFQQIGGRRKMEWQILSNQTGSPNLRRRGR